MPKTCFITGIDPDLYKEFKTACAHYDLSIKEVLTKHMQNIVEEYNNQRQHKPPSIIEPKRRGKK